MNFVTPRRGAARGLAYRRLSAPSSRTRLLRRARAIRVKLGGSEYLGTLFPDKPKRMRWKTYARLYAEERALLAKAHELTRQEALRLWRAIEALTPAVDGRADTCR